MLDWNVFITYRTFLLAAYILFRVESTKGFFLYDKRLVTKIILYFLSKIFSRGEEVLLTLPNRNYSLIRRIVFNTVNHLW